MAAQASLARLEQLYAILDDKKINDKIRRNFNKATNVCYVSKKEIHSSLMKAWKHYNPKAAKRSVDAGGHREAQVSQKFMEFAQDVHKGFNDALPQQMGTVWVKKAKGSNQNVVKFIIYEEDAGAADVRFRALNKQVVQPLLNSTKYYRYFTEENVTAKGNAPSGNMKQLQVAHVRGQAIFDAKQQITADELGNAISMRGMPPEAVETLEKGRSDFLDLMVEHSREVQVKIVNGKIVATEEIGISLQTGYENRLDKEPSEVAGPEQMKMLGEIISNFKKVIESNSKVWGPKAKGSPSVMNLVGSSIVNTPTMTRMIKSRKAKNATKYRTQRIKGSPKTKPKQKTKQFERKTRIIRGGGVTAAMKATGSSRPTGTETGKGGASQQKDFATKIRHLLKVKRAINQRLPAEVRRQMGSASTLNNRTGRFSNSAEVTQILPAAQTLMVKYSYRLDPYETFENRGKRRWPAGYNPKPLIAKSIRGLALGLVDEKLTIRRE